MEITNIIALALLVACAGIGAWTDITQRRLSNWLCLATFVAGLGMTAATAGPDALLSHLGHAGAALAIGLALFAAGVWGGGDGKFYAAVAAWFPIEGFFNLVFAISLLGFATLLVMAIKARGRLFRKDGVGVPYGVAIGSGAVLAAVLRVVP